MGIFKEMLKSNETLFKNPVALDYDFVPKLIPYREKEQFAMARCIKPLLQELNGKNLVIVGSPGVGKTVACKHVLNELEEETEAVEPVYINCWQRNTTHKIILEICDRIGYKFVQNKRTEELFEEIKKRLNKKGAVFVFDEIDKVEDFQFLYNILEGIYKKSVFLITNYKEFILELDERLKSRLTPEVINFPAYSKKETEGILRERANYAFYSGTLEEDALLAIVDKTSEAQDIRVGLYLLREAGSAAEDEASKKIMKKHAESAIGKIDDFSIKKTDDLDDETKAILTIAKEHAGKRIGEVYQIYRDNGGAASYKTFQRKIKKLEENKFITVKTMIGGKDGSTSIVNIKEKTLDEF